MQMYFYIPFTEQQFKLFRCDLSIHRLLLLTDVFNLNSVKVALVKSSSANEFLFISVQRFCNTDGKRKYCFLCSLNH